MEETVLIEQTAKKIKLAELIVLMCLFGSIAAGLGLMYLWLPLGIVMFCAAGLGLMYLWLPLGIVMFCITGISFLAFCAVRVWRWRVNG